MVVYYRNSWLIFLKRDFSMVTSKISLLFPIFFSHFDSAELELSLEKPVEEMGHDFVVEELDV